MRRAATAIAALALLAVGVAAGAATTARLSDVPEDHWAAEAIEWATERGIMRANGEGLFEPNKPVTRAKLAQILYRYHHSGMTIAELDSFFYILSYTDDDGTVYSTSEGFDESHTITEVEALVLDLCETLGDTAANASLREMRDVIPNWIEATTWGRATDDDKWRVVAWGQFALCPEYDSVYDAWSDAGFPPLYE